MRQLAKLALLGDLDTGQFEVVVSNTGSAVVHLVPDRVAELAPPGSNKLVSAYTQYQTMEARASLPVEPGAEITIRAIPSKASCDPDAGYSLPGGSYDLVLPIYLFDAEASEGDPSDNVLLARLEIELG